MRLTATCLRIGVALALGVAVPAEARRLVQDGAIEAHVLDGAWCGETVYVEVRSPTPDSFSGNAFQIRRLASVLSSILPLECPEARRIDLIGSVGGVAIWQGTADAGTGEVVDLPPPEPDALLPIDERRRTLELQASLNALGYDAGPADGVMGPRTQSALRAYQLDRGLVPTYEPTFDVYALLRQDIDPKPGLPPRSAFGTQAAGYPPPVIGQPTMSDAGMAAAGQSPFGGARGVGPSNESAARDFAAGRGLPMIHGRIALPGGSDAPGIVRDVDFYPSLLRLAVRSTPEAFSDPTTTFGLMDLLSEAQRREIVLAAAPHLTQDQQSRLASNQYRLNQGSPQYLGLDEFEMARILETFRRLGLPPIASGAPPVPLPVFIACSATLDRYDFEAGRFELGRVDWCRGLAAKPNSGFSTRFETTGFPQYLEIPPVEAEALRNRLDDGRTIYVGVEATIEGLTGDANSGHVIDWQRESVALYEDANFQRELLRVPLLEAEPTGAAFAGGVAVDPRRIVVGRNGEDLSRIPLLMILAKRPEILENEFILHSYIDLLDEGQVGLLLQRAGLDFDTTMEGYRRLSDALRSGMDEFARRRVVQAFRDEFVPILVGEAPSIPVPLLVYCDVGVGEYDFDAQRFPFREHLQSCETLYPFQNLGSNLGAGASIDLSGMPAGISIPLDQAQAFKERQLSGRSFGSTSLARLGLEASIIGLADLGGEGGVHHFNFEIVLDGAVLYSAADEARTHPILRLEVESHDFAAVDASPAGPVPVDSMETALLLMVRDGLYQPTDREWRQWAGATAREEEFSGGSSPWPDFFGGVVGTAGQNDLSQLVSDALLPHFQDWTRRRAAALPGTFRLWSSTIGNREASETRTLPVFNASRSVEVDVEAFAGHLGVPPENLLVLEPPNDGGIWPEPVSRIAIILPVALDTLRIPFDPATTTNLGYDHTYLELSFANPRRITFQGGLVPFSADYLVLDAVPVGAGVVTPDGVEVASTSFDPASLASAAAPEPEDIDLPPLGYLAIVYERLTGADAVETVSGQISSQLDTFERRRLAEEAVAAARRYRATDEDFWVVGYLSLDEYDFQTNAYAVSSINLSEFEGDPDLTYGGQKISVEPTDPDELAIRMSPEEARIWQRENETHPYYAVRARVTAVAGEMPAFRGIDVKILELELLDRDAVLTSGDPSEVRYAAVIGGDPGALEPEAPAETASPVPETGTFDILGVSLGTDLEHAVETLKAEVAGATIYRAHRAHRAEWDQANLWDPFNEGVMIRAADGNQAVTLYHEPPAAEGRVTAISRWVHFPEGSGPPAAAVRDLLLETYGEPSKRADGENTAFMYWVPDRVEAAALPCDILTIGLGDGRWRVDRRLWIGEDGALSVRDGSAAQMNEPGAFAFEAPGFFHHLQPSITAQCGETLISVVIAGPDGRAQQLLIGISDPAGIAALAEQNRLLMTGEAGAQATAEIDLKL